MQKKTPIQPLRLSRETIRQLDESERLAGVAGGATTNADTQIATGCLVPPT